MRLEGVDVKKIPPQFRQIGDGSQRPLREFQEVALKWLEENWNDSQVFSIVSPTASGKSLLARTVQRATNGAIITNSNLLVNQYRDFYKANVFYGMEWYTNHGAYDEAKYMSCIPEELTIYNPVSFRIAKKQPQFVHPPVIIFDEAHSIISLLQELIGKTCVVNKDERYRQHLDSAPNLIRWLKEGIVEARIAIQEARFKNSKKKTIRALEAREAKLDDLIFVLETEPETIALWYEDVYTHKGTKHYLHIKPTHIPKAFLSQYFKQSKIVLLSATMLPADIREISAGKEYKYLEMGSTIPPERRPFYVIPTESLLSYPTPHKELAEKLDEILTNIPLRPAIVHITYSDMANVSKYLKTPHYFHTPETKKDVLETWLKEGGVLLAGGMSEGLDLHGELCRLNIITKLQFPNLGNDYVQKRLNLPSGREWYALSALKHVVQAYGRSTRGPEDKSVCICLDKRVFKLLNDNKKETPGFFASAVVPYSVTYQGILDRYEKLV